MVGCGLEPLAPEVVSRQKSQAGKKGRRVFMDPMELRALE